MKSIKYIIGDATKPEIGCSGIHIIAHCCNDIGQFGAGFVVPLERRYMGLKQAYKSYIQNTANPIGSVFLFQINSTNLWIANIIGQHDIFPIDGIPPIRYDALKEGFIKTIDTFKSECIHFHLPRLGCGLAGGDWNVVENMLNEMFLFENVKSITVYDLG